MTFKVTDNNIHIQDSAFVSKSEFWATLDYLYFMFPNCSVFQHRTGFSMVMEWAVHNFLYRIGYKRSRTKDVDINYPQKWYATFAYIHFGILTYPFIK